MQDLVPWPGIELVPPACRAWSLNPWTTREVRLEHFHHPKRKNPLNSNFPFTSPSSPQVLAITNLLSVATDLPDFNLLWLTKNDKFDMGELNKLLEGFPGGANDKESAAQCRRLKRWGFHPWVRKVPWRRAWQSTTVLAPGKFRGQMSLASYSPWGCKESDF